MSLPEGMRPTRLLSAGTATGRRHATCVRVGAASEINGRMEPTADGREIPSLEVWEGSATELLAALPADDATRRRRGFPVASY